MQLRGEATILAPSRTPFVGRELEMERLLERTREARRGRPRVCLVRGESGIGKSRLLTELGRHALGQGLHVWSLCGSPHLQTPYLALDALLKDLSATCMCGPALSEASEVWWRLLRGSDNRVDAGAAGFAAPEQRRLSGAFTRALFERAAHGGFLLLIDDLQWLDGPSLELIVEAIGAATERGREERISLAVVTASRGGEHGSAAAWAESRLSAELSSDVLELAGLDDREVEAWLASMGLDPPARTLAAGLRVATGGSPLQLERRLRELQRRDLLVRRGGSWVSSIDPAEVAPGETQTVEPALEPEARRTLRTLALFAAPLTREQLAELTGTDVRAIEEHLRIAVDENWVGRASDRLALQDENVARALVAAIPAEERSLLHREIAEWLDRRRVNDPELLAHHWFRALPGASVERVMEALQRAGEAALLARDWRRAAFHFESAIGLFPSGTGVELGRLHYRAGIAHFRSLDGTASEAHFERAAELFDSTGDAAGVVRGLIEALRARTTLSGAAFGLRVPDLDALSARVEALPEEETELRAYATAVLAETRSLGGSSADAEALARRAVSLAERCGDGIRCRAYGVLGVVQIARTDLEDAAESFRAALRFGRRLGDPWYANIALQRLPLVLAWLGRLDEATSYLLASRKGTESTGDWADFTLTLGTEAAIANALGDFEAVERLARQAVSLARRSGYVWGGALALTALASTRAMRGQLEDALDALEMFGTPGVLVREAPPHWAAIAAVARLRAGVLAGRVEAGAGETARNLAKLLLSSPLDIQILTALSACVEVAAAVGDVALCAQASVPIAEAVRRGVVFAPSLDDVLERVLGLAAAARGSNAEALSHFDAALEAAEQNGARAVEARTHYDLGRVQRAERRPEAARRHFERAFQLATSLGMEPLRRAAGAELAEFGLARAVADRSEALSPDEVRLLRALTRGFDEEALARELLLAPDGLTRLRARAFARIGATSQVEAAAWAHREGLSEASSLLRSARVAAAESADRAPPVRPPGSQRLTVLVSDIANSTELLQRLGDERAHRVVQEHNRLVRRSLHQHQGVELQQTGDGFIAVFDDPAPALRCAVEIQRQIEGLRLPDGGSQLRARVGIHLGEVLLEEGRVFGVVMHTAAHICTSGQAGDILASKQVWDALSDRYGWSAQDLGPIALKGLFEPISLCRIDWRVK